VPLLSLDGRLLGVLDIDSLKLNAFSKEDEKLLLQLSIMLIRETKFFCATKFEFENDFQQ